MTCDGGLELQQVVRAKDGTRKLLFKLVGGEAAGVSVGWEEVCVCVCVGGG